MRREAFYARVGRVGEGAGFALGPALRLNTAVFDFKTSAAVSMKRYFIGEGSIRFPGTIGQDAYTRASGPYIEVYGRRRDFPQEDFFGLGPESQLSDRSNFAVRDSFGRVTGGVESQWLKAGVNAGYLDVTSGAGTDTLMPSSTELFTAAETPGIGVPLAFVVLEPFVELATMDRARNDLAGGIYRVSLAHYRDEGDRYSFLRWEADLRHYFTFLEDTRAIALHAWASSSRPDDAGGEVRSTCNRRSVGRARYAATGRFASAIAARSCCRPNTAGASMTSSQERCSTTPAPLRACSATSAASSAITASVSALAWIWARRFGWISRLADARAPAC